VISNGDNNVKATQWVDLQRNPVLFSGEKTGNDQLGKMAHLCNSARGSRLVRRFAISFGDLCIDKEFTGPA
jgi:hypothetical protein